MKNYGLDDILTVTTEVLMSRRHMDGVYDLLGYMTGEPDITTVALSRAAGVCGPELIRQHPQIGGLKPPRVEGGDVEKLWIWLENQEKRIGRTLEVTPLPEGEWHRKSQLQEYLDAWQGANQRRKNANEV